MKNENKYKRIDLDLNVALVKVYANDNHKEYYFLAIPYGKNNRIFLNVAEYEYLLKISGNVGDDN